MRSIMSVLVFCLFSGAWNPLFSQSYSHVEELPYKNDETLTYILSYTWGGINTEVGEGTAKLNCSDGLCNPVVTGRTYKFYDIFFRVREHFESSFIDSTFRPVSFYRKSEEGKYKAMNRYRFDDENGKIYVTVQKRDDPPIDTVLTSTRYTYDLVTLFYASRAMDFSSIEEGVKYKENQGARNIQYYEIFCQSGCGRDIYRKR